jgi:hypothetical protein
MIKIRNDFHFWADVNGYEGIYRISILGVIKVSKFIKPFLLQVGYNVVRLRKGKEAKMLYMHRLLALHFKYNPNPEKRFIDHLDGIKLNNSLSNLEWVTQAENNRRAYKTGLRNGNHKRLCRRGIHPSAKKVAQLDHMGSIVKIFDCKIDAEEAADVCVGYFIKNRKMCPKGYFWKYV